MDEYPRYPTGHRTMSHDSRDRELNLPWNGIRGTRQNNAGGRHSLYIQLSSKKLSIASGDNTELVSCLFPFHRVVQRSNIDRNWQNFPNRQTRHLRSPKLLWVHKSSIIGAKKCCRFRMGEIYFPKQEKFKGSSKIGAATKLLGFFRITIEVGLSMAAWNGIETLMGLTEKKPSPKLVFCFEPATLTLHRRPYVVCSITVPLSVTVQK